MLNKNILINGKVGTVIKEQDSYVLIKFEFGQFVFNKLSIKSSQIIKD